MIPCIIGFAMGALFTGCCFVLIVPRREKIRDVPVWTEEHYQAPVTTRIINKHRSIEL
jgi:hypothetical protein